MPDDTDKTIDPALEEVWGLLTPRHRQLIVTIAQALATEDASEETIPLSHATAIASEPALARLWETPEEDAAWQHL
jgi:hypothetical protein